MNVRGRQLARALVKASSFVGPGRLIVIVGKDGNVADVVKEERDFLSVLDQIIVPVPEEPPID